MYTQVKPFLLVAASPVHAGAGSDLGLVDQPVQRERHTGYPKIEASGIKGCLREDIRIRKELDDDAMNLIFGPEQGDLNRAAAGMMDARTLLFPVRSVNGVFGLVTCREVLEDFRDILRLAGVMIQDKQGEIAVGNLPDGSLVGMTSTLCIDRNGASDVVLEDVPLTGVQKLEVVDRIAAWLSVHCFHGSLFSQQRSQIAKRIAIVPDSQFADFVRLYTEVIARNRIDDESGTAAGAGLWYEEYLPRETVLYSCLTAARPFVDNPPADLDTADKILTKISSAPVWPDMIQLGGNATIGKGFMKLAFIQ